MSRHCLFIVVLLVVIGVLTSATRSFARVIHCSSISLDVPDTWRAYGRESSSEESCASPFEDDEGPLGIWEAYADGTSHGYLTLGVMKRSSLISPLGARRTRRELENHLRGLSCVSDVQITEFDLLEVDGVPAYHASYTLETHEGEPVDQSLYIVGGSETCFLAFTRATSGRPLEGESSFDEIVESARVRDRTLLLGPSREWSMAILAALAGSSLLYHVARSRARGHVPERVGVEPPERRD